LALPAYPAGQTYAAEILGSTFIPACVGTVLAFQVGIFEKFLVTIFERHSESLKVKKTGKNYSKRVKSNKFHSRLPISDFKLRKKTTKPK
jgi:hypothetical protein